MQYFGSNKLHAGTLSRVFIAHESLHDALKAFPRQKSFLLKMCKGNMRKSWTRISADIESVLSG